MQIDQFAKEAPGRLIAVRGHDGRLGEDYDTFAFMPDPLPTDLSLQSTTWSAVSAATLALGRLDGLGQRLPNPSLLRRPSLRREAHSTSALEGTFAPLADVLRSDDPAGETEALGEVLNYVRVAETAYEWVRERPLTMSLLCELQRMLVAGTPADGPSAGRIRDHQVMIGSPSGRLAEARFVPPPPGHDLEIGCRAWADWVGTPPNLPVVVQAALAHYQFETLHPFNDGNSRLGRLVIVLQLLRAGVLAEPLLTVSPWLEARRREYQDELLAFSQTGDADQWVTFFARALEGSAEGTARRIDQLLAFVDLARAAVRTRGLRGLAVDLTERLIERPVFTIRWVADDFGKSVPAATDAVNRLVDLGLLRETTGGTYGRVFAADDVLRILGS